MTTLGMTDLSSVLEMPESTHLAVQEFERTTWAANLATPDLEPTWRKFMVMVQKVGLHPQLKDEDAVHLLQYLSTFDVTKLIALVGKKSVSEQAEFISTLNWLSAHAKELSPQHVYAADSVLQRLLMGARMSLYPKVYAVPRIQRIAMALMAAQDNPDVVF